jgi:hypothetical protein
VIYGATKFADGFGGSSGPFLPQAETPKPAINAATTIKRMII